MRQANISLALLVLLLVLPAARLLGQIPNVLTWRYDNTHQGQNTQETTLTPTNVNTNTFGKLFSQAVDGQVYAQPLYVSNLSINGATHNVIFVADEHDSVYAFDADSNGGASSAPLWQASMISSAHGAPAGATTVPTADVQGGTGDINPEIGITATPVIDLATQTLFLVAKSKESGNYVQRLHALNLLNGSERSGSPVALSASVPGNGVGSSGGTLAWSSLWQNNRVALGLFNGSLYIGFGSHGDDGPWHGWVLVYKESTLSQTAAWCSSPNGEGDGVWGAGAGLPIDTVTANGRAFLSTGNGDLTSYPPLGNSVDYGESILRFDLSNGGFAISDAFTSYNQAALSNADLDLGSGGVLMLPDQPGTYPHLLVQAGKEGRIVVLNRDGLNGYAGSGAGSNTNAVQDITGALPFDAGLWSTPAYWNGNVYMWASGDGLKMFPIINGVLATRASAQSAATTGFPGPTPVISSSGTQNGILWAVKTDQYNSDGSAVLYAFDATNVAHEFYDSAQNPTRDDAGQAIKFVVPVVTNGKVYIGTGTQVDVYGLLNEGQQAPAPVISPAGGSYGAAQQITMTDGIAGAVIYYTTDGSMPTSSSPQYVAGGFQLSQDATVQAIASASGYVQSAVASATYSFTTQTPAPQFSPAPGTYTSTQSVTITDTNTGATIYYTLDGTTPTTSSTKYSGAITVGSTKVLNAIAVASGLSNSTVTTGSYVIQLPGTSINYANGFSSVAGLTLNGSATNVDDSRLQITSGGANQTGSVFYNTPTNIQAFTTNFSFQLSDAVADGFTFTMQNIGPTAIGGPGGGLGYGPDPNGNVGTGIAKSVAIKFDFYSNSGEGTDSTGLFVNGATPTVPAIDMSSSGVVLTSGDTIQAQMTYDGTNLVMTLTDIVVNKVFTHTFPINIPGTIGSNLAYIGFTGASGGQTASQKILSWTLSSTGLGGSPAPTPAPTFSPAGGTYNSAQNVTISDAGATIYYTLNGTTPTTSSPTYSAAIPVTGNTTISAIAVAPGSTQSSVATATYVIQTTQTAAPTFSPAAGTYTSAQNVTISDAGATIYYTLDGSTPTTSSKKYSSAIPVAATTTISAIAVASGSAQSSVATSTYVIQSGAPSTINFAAGFPSASGLQLNGNTKVNANYLELTDGGTNEAGSAFWTTPVNIQSFTSNFTFQLSSAQADGFTFTIQNAGITALGSLGGGLGYGINPSGGTGTGIANSVGVKFDIYNNISEGSNSTGVFTDGAAPASPDVDLTPSGIGLASGDTISAQLVYNGTTLTLNLVDTVTGKTFTQAFTINIPSTVGGSTAYVGFTGGTGGLTAIQNIKTWTFNSSTVPAAAEPVFSPLPGTYTTAQNVSLTTATAGATIYYTVDGSTPTHSSATYSAPIVASGVSLTIRAFASASGYQDSPIVVGTYQVQGIAATPVISPVSGTTFASSLSVSMTDTTTGATIYYTTNGSTPTTGSTKYIGAFTITASTTVNAIAVATGYTNSSVASAAYTLQGTVATPVISPASGTTFASTLSVSMTDATTGATIYYTTNGSTPTTGSTKYTGTFTISATTTIKAIAVATGYTNSNVATASYSLQTAAAAPAISPASGTTFTSSLSVSITDATTGATIYYTTNGSTPTTGSTKYTGAITITATTTINAIAVAAGYTNSSVASASYTLQTPVATPLISPANGTTFASTLSVSMTDATAGATIYYTTDGSTPTTGSAKYTGAFTISASTTVNAIAVATGYTNSSVASASYTLATAGTINYGSGFGSVAGLSMNGNATTAGSSLELTTGSTNQTSSVFYKTPTNIQTFTTDFTFQLVNAQADGFTFTIQNAGPTALGGPGGGLGYGPDPSGPSASIANSIAVKFDFYNNSGEGTDSTGLFLKGATPTLPAVDMSSSGVVLTSGDTMAAHMTYDGTNLVMTLTDTATNKVFTHTFAVNIPSTIGSNVAYIGFTGASGGITAVQKILTWTFTPQSGTVTPTTPTPTFSPAGGTYTSAQSVTLTDAGATIYYTTDGSTPTSSSAIYGNAINVLSGTVTIKAIAQATGDSISAVASATYTIQALTATATPTFTPAGGTYTSAQSVTIADTTAGAVIYYTTDGSTPTTGSAVYSNAAIPVAASMTLKALALAPNYTQSGVATAAYVIQSSSNATINFGSGFPNGTGLQLNGNATVNSGSLELTDGGGYEAGSAFWMTPVNVQSFTTNFTFQLSSAQADGFTFTIQNTGVTALGSSGGGLGFGADPSGPSSSIGKSVAVKFDIYSNSGEGTDSTGVFTNGVSPTVPAVDLTSSGIQLSSGDTMSAQLVYSGTTLTLNLTDTVTNKTFTQAFTVNIPSTLGANTGYVGFTGGTGGLSAIQNIKTWTFTTP